ncbi:RNA polymerase [Macleaya cordata]|uniref:DNA-directed RNA polymerase n=1 Tax=Macleaya cordata TaxID=56857 RepID=A0A200R1G6_MACCD|nr:RNA polymerase [Macleaya cordata]
MLRPFSATRLAPGLLDARSLIRDNGGKEKSSNAPCSYCLDMPPISIRESNAKDGAFCLELKLPRSRFRDGMWDFLERYGFLYGHEECRTLLPCEVLEILKRIPAETKKKLSGKGYFPQDGYILQKLPVPPNCLSVPDISDGTSIMSSDLSVSMLKKVLKQAEIIKTSRSGPPNFESHEVEATELQSAIAQYLHVRGTTKAPHDMNSRFGISTENDSSSTKAWLEKMKTLFISKGSGFSSRSVITGDAYKRVDEIGVPLEIAQRITFEEKVTVHNKKHLQELVDKKLCLTYRDGVSTYSLREGSMSHTSLRVGQVVHRRIMDGDIVFINRPPSTHKHSLQAFSVYIHDEHTVKINPLICGPLGADFDGDCIHLFYPQSLAAKAEVLELFSVEQQLLSSHSGILNLQMANDALLSLKIMLKRSFLEKATAQQLGMFVSSGLQLPALFKANCAVPQWTALQILQNALPADFDCVGERYVIRRSEIVKFDYNRDVLQSIFNDIISSVFFKKGSQEALRVFNSLQPLLMENIFLEGYSVSLEDFCIPKSITQELQRNVQGISPLLYHLRSTYNEVVELQVENHLRSVKVPVSNFILKASALGNLIDSKSDSSINKVVQQLGFLGLQLFDRGRFYTRTLVEDMTSFFQRKYAIDGVDLPSEAFGLIKSCFFHGLNPYEKLVDSISSREVLVRSSRGLTEPGTLFKNLMAILRDVVICYDGTVRNVCSNSIIQFQYGGEAGSNHKSFSPAGEPVGVLAATAMSNPAYKAVLDSSPSSNSSWELMKEILVCRVNFKNDLNDRRVILYLNDCGCGKKYCKENAAYLIQDQLKRRNLKYIANDFLVEYKKQQASNENSETTASLVGHIHLNKTRLKEVNRSLHQLVQKCQERISSIRKKKDRLGRILKALSLSVSEGCCFPEWSEVPCLQFTWQDTSNCTLEQTSQLMANTICSILLETIIKGDPRVNMANIIWVSPDTTTWVGKPSKIHKGELALEIILEKEVVKQHGDTWRIVLDSCLPVIHLIDTRRSIPYAIKHLQEFIGISCAFDQAVQRLETSIRMVAKGVLKEHLTLVANSMTCTGNLIGFNTGGFKALFRSLNVQVPFTEATLVTPRKCFEKAAEKCHLDSLSSTVASCSWGKRVAVGTGTRFEILWNKKETGLDQNSGIDVFNFLQLVRTGTNEGELGSGCLGEDIDDIELENGDIDLTLSPENSNGGKPIFDDSAEVENLEQNQIPEGNWGRDSSQTVESGSWGEWKVDKGLSLGNSGAESKSGAWSGWGSADNVPQLENHSTKALEESPRSGGWNTTEFKKKRPLQPEPCDSWGEQAEKANTTGRNNMEGKAQWSQWNESSNLGTNLMQEQDNQPISSHGWGSSNRSGGWNTTKDATSQVERAWGKQDEETDKSGGTAQWGQEKDSHNWDTNKMPEMVNQPTSSRGWGKQDEEADASGWNKSGGKAQWEEMPNQPTSSRDWGKQEDEVADKGGWNKSGAKAQWGQETNSTNIANQPTSSHGWGSTDAGEWTKNESHTQREQQNESPVKARNAWGTNMVDEQVNQPPSSHVWGSSDGGDHNENDVQWSQRKESPVKSHAWGTQEHGKRPGNSRGWGSSNSGDWKNKSRPTNPQGKLDDQNGWNSSGIFTATRQRLDLFTSEEQNVLSEVEPIIQSIKRIMSQSRETDGDPLSAEDQSYVLDNVFNYHPDKAVKMGAGIDHVMEKHPAVAESFISKYFRKPREGGANKNRVDVVGTPVVGTPT